MTNTQESEMDIVVDYSSLPTTFKNLKGEEHLRKTEAQIQKKISALEKTLSNMHVR